MTADMGEKILIEYMHPSTGQHIVNGPITKTNYGYWARGDKFYVFQADINARPGLFRPVQEERAAAPKAAQVPKETIRPAAIEDIVKARGKEIVEKSQEPVSMSETLGVISGIATLDEKDEDGTLGPIPPEHQEPAIGSALDNVPFTLPVNERTLNILKKAGVTTVEQIRNMSIEELTEIKGIGEKTADSLKEQIEVLD